jgi:3-oxoacyl-[acyl-carrier-protein] synthase-3
MRKSRIESLGTYLPSTIVSTEQLVASMAYPPTFDLEAVTGIRERRVCGPQDDCLSLAMNAARDALARSRYSANDLDLVVSTSISRRLRDDRMYFEPALSHAVCRGIGAEHALRFDVSNACAGMMSGLYIADSMIRAGAIRTAMVVSGEDITLLAETATQEIRHASDPQFAALTVGDSGAALIVDEATDEDNCIEYIELMTCAEHCKLCVSMPSDRGGTYAMYMNNLEVQKNVRAELWVRFLTDFLAKRGRDFTSERFDYVVHHQVSSRAIAQFQQRGSEVLATPMPPSLECFEWLGNTASTSLFVTLREHLRGGSIKKGAKIAFVPAASGLVVGWMSARISLTEGP